MKSEYQPSSYRSNLNPTWCKGCSFFGILSSLTRVCALKQLDPSRLNIISGIGCSSRMPLYFSTFGMHTLHGRAIPVAIGARLAQPDIPVIVTAGDGDLFSIGIGHFVHAARKNFDMTVICMDNRMFAMTKNQASPTSAAGYRGSLTPYGKISAPLNVLDFAISSGATFVSRTFSGSPSHMQEIFSKAFDHKGFSFVDVMAPCKTFDKTVSRTALAGRLVDINKDCAHDPRDKKDAQALANGAFEYDEKKDAKIPVGIFWERQSPTFESKVAEMKKRSGKVRPKELLEEFRI